MDGWDGLAGLSKPLLSLLVIWVYLQCYKGLRRREYKGNRDKGAPIIPVAGLNRTDRLTLTPKLALRQSRERSRAAGAGAEAVPYAAEEMRSGLHSTATPWQPCHISHLTALEDDRP